MNSKASESIALLTAIDPDAYVASTVLSAYVPMANYKKAFAVVYAGTLGASATLDAKVRQATDASGTGVKDITGKAITQLTQAGTDSDKQVIINVDADDLDRAGGFTHIVLSMTVGVATSDAGGAIYGVQARYQPVTQATTVDEVVG